MLICPICNTEYRDGAGVCKLCGAQLVDQNPRYVEEENSCHHCGEGVSAQDQFCLHCGYLKNVNFVAPCQNHRDRPSIGVCVLCRKELCKDCAGERNDRLRCAGHYEVEIREEWAAVFGSADSVELTFAREILESEGIPSHPYEVGGSHLVVPLVMEAAIPTWNGDGGVVVNVFVPMMDFTRAVEVLRDHKLVFRFECGHCGHRFNDEALLRCPNCGDEFVD